MKPINLMLSACFVIFGLIAVGCSSSKSKVGGVFNLDTDLKLTLVSDASINPDDSQRPSPLYLRFYQLTSTERFEKADFIDIYERDTELFGNSMIDKTLLKPLTPNETRDELLVLKPGTRYVGVYAEFSQYAGSSYKVIFPVTENNVIKNKATIEVSGRKIHLKKAK